MNEINTTKLFTDFPRLYRGRNKPETQSLMSWGFACGDGWFGLIYALSAAIEREAESVGLDPWPEAAQVKEKFGALRFYLDLGNSRIRELISDAEGQSAVTCESCGLPGKSRSGAWIHTYCDACEAEYRQEMGKE